MCAYAIAEGWVCLKRRSWRGGREAEPMRRQLPALYNSVSQKQRCYSQDSAAGRVSEDYRPVRPNHFCSALCWREDSTSGLFSRRGGLFLLPWAPDRPMRRKLPAFWPIFQDLWVATRTPRTPLLSPSPRWRIWAITADRRRTASTNIIRARRTDSPWTLTTISLIWTGWGAPERTPPNQNTTQTATDSSDITTEITCRLRPPAQVSVTIVQMFTALVFVCEFKITSPHPPTTTAKPHAFSILFSSFRHDFVWLSFHLFRIQI